MTTGVEGTESALIDAVCLRVRERVEGDDAARLEQFVRLYHEWVPAEDLADRDPLDVYGAALAQWNFMRRRKPGTTKARVYNPDFEQHGWQSTHTVVEVVTDDMPFLVDSIGMELSRQSYGVHLVVHPVLRVRRDEEGALLEVLPGAGNGAADGSVAESIIRFEIDRQSEAAELDALRDDVLRVLGDVRAAVEDWPAMRARAREIADDLGRHGAPVDAREVEEAIALLSWADEGHFTFLGARDYELVQQDGADCLRAVPKTALGVLRRREEQALSKAFARLPPRARASARSRTLLTLTKANSIATVHRPSYLDYIGVKQFDADGEVVGERRFLGLYTTSAYSAHAHEVPVVRRKVEAVMARAGFPPGGHGEKALAETLETDPRDELFQIGRTRCSPSRPASSAWASASG